MPLNLHAAITFDGRLCPLPARCQAPGATVFRNGRRAAGIVAWAETLDPQASQRCEILTADASGVAAALLAGGCVDELHLTICPIISGRREAPTLTGPPTPNFLPAAISLQVLAMEPEGDICHLRYRVVNSQRRLPASAAGNPA